ncbi:DNase I-like protein [Cylindrobasidium torrendii FP15055 ss-10]|uniref:DNA-(apurinic or apyrimidinic site) endonuclease n=1 Tax=Cylindrobasidium torrendii FP15055 ss-10 TaxID=1314674 RepID=A0A0D7BH26_9AGAR|nr:DNase I-like protein [Cylindrobasidium torrendii FP15055 ss-10]
MRILTWNINGIRTIPQYHPWNGFKTQQARLDHLNADIVCFQEMKSSRKALTKDIAAPETYDAFISLPLKKSGYSGVATYTRRVPCKAEEGLTGLLDTKPPLTATERVSSHYPKDIPDLANLDSEGRAVTLDFGAFVLINVYAPNDGTETEDRIQFKIDYQKLLSERVRQLVEVEKREVIVLGDLNACAALIDHCEGPIMAKKLGLDPNSPDAESAFWAEKECRGWLHNWLVDAGGPFVDVVRQLHPDRKGMFTCWNTKISARESNYGTRIDYILVTPGLMPFVRGADIQADVKGSDHCPVYLDLDDAVMEGHATVESAPRLCAKYWDEYKQKSLGDFFGKKDAKPAPPKTPSQTQTPSTSQLSSSSQPLKPSTSLGSLTTSAKRKRAEPVPASTKKAKKGTIASFFTSNVPPLVAEPETEDEDYKLALALSQQPPSPSPAEKRSPSASRTKEKAQWNTLLARIPPPRCTVHDEPARELTTKQGTNKGKMFWICSRPVGPGYDRGREERRREDVNPEYRCDFFKWSNDVRREAMAKRESGDVES